MPVESQYPKFQTVNQSGGGTTGGEGATLISDTTPRTGNWYAIAIVQSAVFNTLAASNWDGNNTNGLSVGAGQIIYGNFTSITLTSGVAIAYK